MLSPEVQNSAARSVLCWLATVDANGQPNVSPKEIFAVFDTEHLVIANIASPTSVRNIEVNPLVCVSFIDVFVQKGFKVRGTAHNVRRQDPDFSRWAALLEAKAGPRFPIHSVLVVRAHSVEPILAPSYRLYAAETTEQSQLASAMRTYGVQPAHGDAYNPAPGTDTQLER
jgi:predicted pyridoxine 5'-phosphate oxidase superfamily flavin-nucleotide-binding protein